MNKSDGNAYILVMIIMMALFLMTSAAVGISASGRRTSVRYINFAGLYDLAAGGCERALFVLRDIIGNQIEEFATYIIDGMKERGMDGYLKYEDGGFYLDGFMPLFRRKKINELNDFIENLNGPVFLNWQPRQWRYFSYYLTVSTGTYSIKTHIFHTGGGNYDVLTTAVKEVNGTSGAAMPVQGRISWPNFTFKPEIVPLSYTWRADVPPLFDSAVKSSMDLSSMFNWENLPSAHNWTEENAFLVTSNPYINTDYYEGVSTLLIYTGFPPLEIYGTKIFNGIIISGADVNISTQMRGSVISVGEISHTHIIHDPYILFSIPIEKNTQKTVFDFLGITNFSGGRNVNEVLGDITIENFADICFEPLSEFIPRLSALQNVAN